MFFLNTRTSGRTPLRLSRGTLGSRRNSLWESLLCTRVRAPHRRNDGTAIGVSTPDRRCVDDGQRSTNVFRHRPRDFTTFSKHNTVFRVFAVYVVIKRIIARAAK